MEPTLGQIKEYIRVHNINLKDDKILKNDDDIQLYGDSEDAELYFQYYLEHSVEIHKWLNNEEKESEMSNRL